jgi:hypothetical protein
MYDSLLLKNLQEIYLNISKAKVSMPIPKELISSFQNDILDICRNVSSYEIHDLEKISNKFTLVVKNCCLDSLFNSEIVYTYLSDLLYGQSLQKNLRLEDLNQQLQSTRLNLKKYLNFSNSKFFAHQSTAMRNKKQYLGKKSYTKLKFFLIYVETLLQQTATLSQQGNHMEALEKVSECFSRLKVILLKFS